MQTFTSPFGELKLQRMPLTRDEPLRAWDAADEYLLTHLYKHPEQLNNAKRVGILNDQFGALASALSLRKKTMDSTNTRQEIICWGDSKLSELAIDHNSRLNALGQTIQTLPSTQQPSGDFNLLMIKIPKVLGLLEHQLIGLKKTINEKTIIIAAGMTRHIHNSTLAVFERIIGSTTTSLAAKKARLIYVKPQQRDTVLSPFPIIYKEPSLKVTLTNHANVFSKDKLDIGARFFIENFKKLPNAEHIIDLGCGNGVLTVMASKSQPKAQFHLVDESYMAIESARQNIQQSLTLEQCHFYISDCLSQYTGPKVDLILCNPPFHQQHALGDQIAWRMFKQSANKLNNGGQLWVVANRHLGYHHKLKRLFKFCVTIASNKKFVILQASQKSPN